MCALRRAVSKVPTNYKSINLLRAVEQLESHAREPRLGNLYLVHTNVQVGAHARAPAVNPAHSRQSRLSLTVQHLSVLGSQHGVVVVGLVLCHLLLFDLGP